MTWKKTICQCGLGDPHYMYTRSDQASVTLCHGMKGDKLSKTFIGFGPYGVDEIRGFRSAERAMHKVDEMFPIESV
ncbi:hypothetical protein [Zooshikella sp. RANM57]|uniref:hypothetical protein n=1 Tax=Zooshikella sp. RANM57 TaxID=3425863 RepID=UPI003D6F210A